MPSSIESKYLPVYTIGAKSVLMIPNVNAACAWFFWSCKITWLWRVPSFTRLSSAVNFGNTRLANTIFTMEIVIELLHIRRATVSWDGTFMARTATNNQLRVAAAERVNSYRTENQVWMPTPAMAGAAHKKSSGGTIVLGLQLVHLWARCWFSM